MNHDYQISIHPNLCFMYHGFINAFPWHYEKFYNVIILMITLCSRSNSIRSFKTHFIMNSTYIVRVNLQNFCVRYLLMYYISFWNFFYMQQILETLFQFYCLTHEKCKHSILWISYSWGGYTLQFPLVQVINLYLLQTFSIPIAGI